MHCRGRQVFCFREKLLECGNPEVIVRIRLADEYSGQLLATVQNLGGQSQGIGAGEACVDQNGFLVTAYQGGIDMKAVTVGVIDFEVEGVRFGV